MPVGPQLAEALRDRGLTKVRPYAGRIAILSVVVALLAGCETLPEETRATPPAARGAPASSASAADRRAAVPERDRVLHDYRAAAKALRAGDYDEAKARLDDAIARIGGIIANDAEAERARGLFSPESTKVFIGEPYERVMAYYYRGLLYWRDGERDNARACFRTGQVIDTGPEQDRYEADYVLLDYLDGLASAKLGADGGDALARARRHAVGRFTLPDYDPAANVLLFAEFGYGPRKYAGGQYGEQLRFHVEDSPSRSARLVLDGGRRIVPLPAYDDLGFQATTRGGRVMDFILGNKAHFKAAADTAADLALVGSAIASDAARRRDRRGKDDNDAEVAAVGLGVLGVIGKIASAATHAEADTRQWNNLPQRLSFAALRLPPGTHLGRVEFLDREGRVLASRSQPVKFTVAPADRDTVLFFSEHKP